MRTHEPPYRHPPYYQCCDFKVWCVSSEYYREAFSITYLADLIWNPEWFEYSKEFVSLNKDKPAPASDDQDKYEAEYLRLYYEGIL